MAGLARPSRWPSERLRAMRRRVAPWLPAPTIRLRLTLLYGMMFLLTGAVLLTIGYALVRHNVDARPNFRDVAKRLGFPGPPPGFARFRFGPGSPDARVALAVRAQLRDSALHRLLVEYIVALVMMTGVSVAAGWLLAGRALRPLRAIIGTARRVSGENLGERIALRGPADELKELADTFDGMLARLDHAFASQRHFVANASHELRTPLAVMRAEVDVALGDPAATATELRSMGEGVREMVDRSERLIESLLVLARSEAGTGTQEPVDLAALAADCVTDLGARARAAGVRIEVELQPASVLGDERLLERMVANLVENGVRHNRAGGELVVRCAPAGASEVALEVGSDGDVIDAATVARLSEPFVRLDRSTEGFGLGLSIVGSVVEAHGGAIRLEARPAGGLLVQVRLPAASGEPGRRGQSPVPAFTRI